MINFTGKIIVYNNKIYIARLSGVLQPGTKSNEQILDCYEQILLEIDREEIKKLILDFTKLHYEHCNALASLWVRPLLLEIVSSCAIIAQGETQKSVENLMEITPFEVPVVENLEKAITLL